MAACQHKEDNSIFLPMDNDTVDVFNINLSRWNPFFFRLQRRNTLRLKCGRHFSV